MGLEGAGHVAIIGRQSARQLETSGLSGSDMDLMGRQRWTHLITNSQATYRMNSHTPVFLKQVSTAIVAAPLFKPSAWRESNKLSGGVSTLTSRNICT